ncbi:MAG: hypothetical protein IPM24_01480 [Bryobacterales bacterium]|nr:hypothetical protein [Bryobacterales bacterium]
MNCLWCGRQLAVFRKTALGEFCGLEHRALYLAEQSASREAGPGTGAAVTEPEPGPLGPVRVTAVAQPPDPALAGFAIPLWRGEIGTPEFVLSGEAAAASAVLPGAWLVAAPTPFRFSPRLALPKLSLPGLAPEAEEPEPAVQPISAFDVPSMPVRPPVRPRPLDRLADAESAEAVGPAPIRPVAQLRLPTPAFEPVDEALPRLYETSERPGRLDPDEYSQYFVTLEQQAKARQYVPPPWKQYLPNPRLLLGVMALCSLMLSSLILLTRLGPTMSARESSGGAAWVGRQIESLRAQLRTRAAIRHYEDFRSGLSGWSGPAGWSKDWSYDQAGFLRPGRFGLWRDSMALADYRLEFLGQIERTSLGWVFRAGDDRNYYAAKITITKPGPLPMADLVRYTVSDGKAGPATSVPLPFSIRNDTIYRVQMDLNGNHFTTRINGRMVDSWSDGQYRSGGVGFLSEAGELARVRWLRVSHRDDFLGRVCSFLTARGFLPMPVWAEPSVLSAFSYPPLEIKPPL